MNSGFILKFSRKVQTI